MKDLEMDNAKEDFKEMKQTRLIGLFPIYFFVVSHSYNKQKPICFQK
jgi:hypothetical protein